VRAEVALPAVDVGEHAGQQAEPSPPWLASADRAQRHPQFL
jgi:hypothetical protein